MIVTTEKRYCDRCKKEIEDRKYYKGWRIAGDRIKINGVKVKKWGDDAELDLCDDCRKSLTKWMTEYESEFDKEYYQK